MNKRLTIENIERLKGAGSFDSPVIVSIGTSDDKYQITMHWEGRLWNVHLSRTTELNGDWCMSVQKHGNINFLATEINAGGLSTAQQFLLVVETLMRQLIGKPWKNLKTK